MYYSKKIQIVMFLPLFVLGCQTLAPQVEKKPTETKDVPWGCKVLVPDVSSFESRSPAAFRKASPDKMHVIDIAFLHKPFRNADDRNNLKENITELVTYANQVFQNSSVNARLRIVAIKESLLIGGSISSMEQEVLSYLPKMRATYGADLLYTVVPVLKSGSSEFCGVARIRLLTMPNFLAAIMASTGIIAVNPMCMLQKVSLIHEVGHNLGLRHQESNVVGLVKALAQPIQPFRRRGRGYINRVSKYGTIMSYSSHRLSYLQIPRFSSTTPYILSNKDVEQYTNQFNLFLDLHKEYAAEKDISSEDILDFQPLVGESLTIGHAGANASKALLYTIEDASNYAPTVVPEDVHWEDFVAQ